MTETILAIVTAITGLLSVVSLYNSNRAKAQLDRANATAVDATTFQNLVDKVNKLSTDLTAEQEKTGYLWGYVIQFLEDYNRRNIRPPTPPKALESDPLIAKFFSVREKKQTPKRKAKTL